jgi:hypothetical protein
LHHIGLILAQVGPPPYTLDYYLNITEAVFLAYMVVLKKPANVGLSVVLLVVTALAKIMSVRLSIFPLRFLTRT